MSQETVNSITFAKALADETRQKIMSICCCKWLNVGEILEALKAEETMVSQPTVSHHLSILRAAGLVNSRREGKQIFYSLNQEKIAAACCQLADDFAPELELVISK